MHGYPRGYRGVARGSWGVSTDMDEQMKQHGKALQRHAAQIDRAATRVRGPDA